MKAHMKGQKLNMMCYQHFTKTKRNATKRRYFQLPNQMRWFSKAQMPDLDRVWPSVQKQH
jgi:hypothetical protein